MELDYLGLIRPMSLGAEAVAGWVLVEAEAIAPGQFTYVFQPRDRSRGPLAIFVCDKVLEERGYRETRFYTVAYQSDPGERLPREALVLVDEVVERIRENEREPEHRPRLPSPVTTAEPRTTPRLGAEKGQPTLFLVPGHLGDEMDLGRRSLRLLAHVPNIFVEAGTATGTASILSSAGVDPGSKRIVEVDRDPANDAAVVAALEAILERNESACLFGVAEGAPAFVDPGSGLIQKAGELGFAVQSIGGPSSLTQALMRIEEDLQEFLFLGRLEGESDVGRIVRRASWMPGVALVIFTDALRCDSLLPPLLERLPWTDGWLLADLTTDHERVLRLRADAPIERAALRDDSRVIAILHTAPAVQGPMPPERGE